MFRMADARLWEETGGNPAAFIKRIGSRRLEQLANDQSFLDTYDDVVSKFDAYMNRSDTWFSTTYPELSDHMVAYFSAEYGLSETLPVYSGGSACCPATIVNLPVISASRSQGWACSTGRAISISG